MPNSQAFNTLISSRRTFIKALTFAFAFPRFQKLSPFANVPPPRFWFGDRVVDKYFGEDPQDMTRQIECMYHGTVVGLAWGKSHDYCDPSYESWWYQIELDAEPGYALTNPSYPEKELSFEDF